MQIGLISDTHGFLDPKVKLHFKNCDEIWHAGDIGSFEIVRELEAFKPFKAVYGNIDNGKMQARFPEDLWISAEGFTIWITHIGGSPPNYNPKVKTILRERTPDIFICGHSHILKIIKDPAQNNMLYLNPGAAGNQGFHHIKTIVRFELSQKEIKNLEVIELGKRGAL